MMIMAVFGFTEGNRFVCQVSWALKSMSIFLSWKGAAKRKMKLYLGDETLGQNNAA